MYFSILQGYFEGVGIWEYGTTMMVSMVLSILLHSSIETYTWVSAGIILILCTFNPSPGSGKWIIGMSFIRQFIIPS